MQSHLRQAGPPRMAKISCPATRDASYSAGRARPVSLFNPGRVTESGPVLLFVWAWPGRFLFRFRVKPRHSGKVLFSFGPGRFLRQPGPGFVGPVAIVSFVVGRAESCTSLVYMYSILMYIYIYIYIYLYISFSRLCFCFACLNIFVLLIFVLIRFRFLIGSFIQEVSVTRGYTA